MGRIHIDLFTTLDGVAQAPGGPEEDPSDDFQFGGWQAPLIDEVVGQQVQDGINSMDALLLGRKTYDIFASYWPHQEGGTDDSIARRFNRVPKYVASRQTLHLEWPGSSLLGPNLPEAIAELRERHDEVHVIGSLDFVQSLLEESLYDRLTLWVYPILLGPGKRVFAEGSVPTSLKLLEPVVVSPSGAVMQRYERLEGRPLTGDMGARD
ncbi:deaminase [Leucobacter coleopterorum]|uniref:Deaminase n=1 Tax=Leucobacter coleopterorum TaxID=2714933 RepID=A0ABX6JVT1_9MICO|nr:dihydrofolate reductase family protein [Leucobacter coleopterorum]QIM18403.1 deaminase [Leucobacter coleopterorum]